MKHLPTLMIIAAAALLPAGAAAYEIGDTLDDFTLPELWEGEASLYDHLGDVIVLNFFATWCPGCNEEAQVLQNDIWEVYQSEGVSVISINIQEPQSLVQDWAQAQGVDYHIWLAPDYTLFQQFPSAAGLPYNAVIDRAMVLRFFQVGFDQAQLVDWIETILDEDAVAAEGSTWSGVKATFR
jgi:peroxiredoxin